MEGFDVANIYNRQSGFAAGAAKDWETYESYKSRPPKPTSAEISLSIPASEATKHTDSFERNMQTMKFTNSQNIERERALHKQVKEQLLKDGYITKAAVISGSYSSRSDKGRALLGQ